MCVVGVTVGWLVVTGELSLVESWAEGEPPPAEVLGQPLSDLEGGNAGLPVQPDRRDLGDRQPHPARLGGQLQTDLEAVPAVNAHLLDPLAVVGLERVGGVAGSDS